MSFNRQLSREKLKADGFTHKGWYALIVPIYIGNIDDKYPSILERNGIPEWYLNGVMAMVDWLSDRLIRTTGEIK